MKLRIENQILHSVLLSELLLFVVLDELTVSIQANELFAQISRNCVKKEISLMQYGNIYNSIEDTALAYSEDKVLVYNLFAGLIRRNRPKATLPPSASSNAFTYWRTNSKRIFA